MTTREYAAHREARGLPGTTHNAVQVAIKSGRLRASLTDDGKRIRDPDLADAEWLESTDATSVPGSGPTAPASSSTPNPLAEARTRREAAQASIREMELAQRRGELVLAKDIEAELEHVFAQCRAKLLGLPSRARQRDPSLSGSQLRLLESLIREALEDLAGGSLESSERAG